MTVLLPEIFCMIASQFQSGGKFWVLHSELYENIETAAGQGIHLLKHSERQHGRPQVGCDWPFARLR